MTSLEIIDSLCAVTKAQSDIIRDLATFIEEQLAVDEEIKKSIIERCDSVENQRCDVIERCYPPYYSAMQKGEKDG